MSAECVGPVRRPCDVSEGKGGAQVPGGTAQGHTSGGRNALALKEGGNGADWKESSRISPVSSVGGWIAGLGE